MKELQNFGYNIRYQFFSYFKIEKSDEQSSNCGVR